MNIVSRQWIRIFKSDISCQNVYNIGKAFVYKSAFALDNLYPTSNLKLYSPTFTPENPDSQFNGYIPMNELQIRYSRSSGPGGQHVNCTNSKVNVRFHVVSAKWLSDEIKEKLLKLHHNRITKDGYLVIKSEITKSQQLNLADALGKLRMLIWDSIKPLPEVSAETMEAKRKQKLSAARKRLFEKRKRSEIKQARNEPIDF
ncbi:large ribosomal subunit protein mL62 [Megachile rotundata]|uniref:large ribosomal subunit protein mL62 n=1 Tax=Megachile rotundata TaxID=143995 RepID=UPI000258ED3B|nr:PREDICTED: peptidyl-tRNA hydrolase ICT1, mitochondrial [Megachile rotundata]